jgi:hypothetical protein
LPRHASVSDFLKSFLGSRPSPPLFWTLKVMIQMTGIEFKRRSLFLRGSFLSFRIFCKFFHTYEYFFLPQNRLSVKRLPHFHIAFLQWKELNIELLILESTWWDLPLCRLALSIFICKSRTVNVAGSNWIADRKVQICALRKMCGI